MTRPPLELLSLAEKNGLAVVGEYGLLLPDDTFAQGSAFLLPFCLT